MGQVRAVPDSSGRTPTSDGVTPTSWNHARRIAATVGSARTLGTVIVPLGAAAGLTAATAVRAVTSLPGFDASAMDGWAVAGAGPWRVGRGVSMGSPPGPDRQAHGTARPITTGGALPAGADAVLRSESGELRLVASTHPGSHSAGGRAEHWLHANAWAKNGGEPRDGQHIRRAGEEISAGDTVWAVGTRLTPPRLALAAASGIDSVAVRQRPRIAVLVTGDEIVEHGAPAEGRVRDVFGPMLPSMLHMLGAELVSLKRVADSREAVTEGLRASGAADIVITTGGSANGQGDWVRQSVLDTGGALHFAGVRMRPGHPVMLATRDDGCPLLALPGNPLAAVACLLSFLPPMLAAMTGAEASPLPTVPAEQLTALGVTPHARDTLLVPFQWLAGQAVASRSRGAAMLRGLADADGLIVLDADADADADAGAARVLHLPWTA